MRGRIYDAFAGRFTSADPIMQAPFRSQGLNRYSYVFNDPVNNVDPTGFFGEDAYAGIKGILRMGYGSAGGGPAAASFLGGLLGGIGGGLQTVSAGGLGGGSPGATYTSKASSANSTSAGSNSTHAAAQNRGGLGPGYPTPWEAARAALAEYNPRSISSKDPNDRLSSGNEYGGLIYERGGRYHCAASPDEVEGYVDVWKALSRIPAESRNRVVGDFHTHGGHSVIAPGETFSGPLERSGLPGRGQQKWYLMVEAMFTPTPTK